MRVGRRLGQRWQSWRTDARNKPVPIEATNCNHIEMASAQLTFTAGLRCIVFRFIIIP